MTAPQTTSFMAYLSQRIASGGFTTEDTLAAFLPLAREVFQVHTSEYVAPLRGIQSLQVTDNRIWFEQARGLARQDNLDRIHRLQSARDGAVEIIGESAREVDLDSGGDTRLDLAIGSLEDEFSAPVYLPGFECWEHQLGHHDPITDIFSLGMILASMGCGLDLSHQEALRSFVQHRQNPFQLNPLLHPVVARAITQMTELDRRRRPQDLATLILALENYRDQEIDLEYDLRISQEFRQSDSRGKRDIVLHKLRDRLFEVTRRNRLLHFRPTSQTVNLTQASVPLSFDVASIRPDQILTFNPDFAQRLCANRPISLNKYLNFAEALYLPSVLDRVAAEARRDEAEYGFAQLRLVACFLNWSNLKESPVETYHSPLVLVPVTLRKKKGIRDTYALEVVSTEAEVNPVVRHQFDQLYGIQLPESVELSRDGIDKLYAELQQAIQRSEPAVELLKIERPRVSLIHDKAKRRLDQYQRRARLSGRGVRSYLDLDYSYDPANYHPLGIKLFVNHVRRSDSHLRALLEESPRPRSYFSAPEESLTQQQQRTFYELENPQQANPYSWSFDLCNVTLANFKYRRMSLVRDYESLLVDQPDNPAFQDTFSLSPKRVRMHSEQPLDWLSKCDVVPCDPTQSTAIVQARRGESYIIQGPPGTGKSQTISNLLADYAARGQRVLFVCEKRAAIDVVYARLKQVGLGDLCCLIHDSQADKRGFVMDLKRTYESFLAHHEELEAAEARHTEIAQAFERQRQDLEEYHQWMREDNEFAGMTVAALLQRCISLQACQPELDARRQEQLPHYALWHRHRITLQQYEQAVQELREDGILAHHPLHVLSSRLLDQPQPIAWIDRHLPPAIESFNRIIARLRQLKIPPECWSTLGALQELIAYAERLRPVADSGRFQLLDSQSELGQSFDLACDQLADHAARYQAALGVTQGWRAKLPAADTQRALEQARTLEQSSIPWLKFAWWRLRGVMNRSYDFRQHAVRPTWSQILQELLEEHQTAETLEQTRNTLRQEYRIEGDLQDFIDCALEYRLASERVHDLSPALTRLHTSLVNSPSGSSTIMELAGLEQPLDGLLEGLGNLIDQIPERTTLELLEQLSQVSRGLDALPDYLRCLTVIKELPAQLRTALQSCPWPVRQLESAMAFRSWRHICQLNPHLDRFSGSTRQRMVQRLETLYDEWLESNADSILRDVRQRFQDKIKLTTASSTSLSDEEKELRKTYRRGRRELEHEFGKSMRYKAIRDLVSGETGHVIKDLKPLWLMSPLSVSDTLPLDVTHMDVVIFDEASQITLEEAVPSLFRATQCIVVGDEMQLPPTDFFSSKRDEPEEDEFLQDEDEPSLFALDSNSFLNHASRNLDVTMLGWHYRSRSESLISFSNWAFYDGRLLTVPDEQRVGHQRLPIVVRQPEDAQATVEEVTQRSLSFHHLPDGVYENRRNRSEALYIAHLVRELLRRNARDVAKARLSIGIVAFSEAQQSEIESAIESLAQQDPQFRQQLDEELEREEDGQYVGLLIKNLENIQGDERDIILLSVCYGHDANGRMLMNFGPINRTGGEKRLNVAFSRAKHHMVLVSSITFAAITNEYNVGANCLRNYLKYAEAVSTGDHAGFTGVLRSLAAWPGTQRKEASEASPVVQAVADALSRRGWKVDLDVGQSHFRCQLAIYRDDEPVYRLGLLIDDRAYERPGDIVEREMMRPKLLRIFGWRILHVLSQDWLRDSDAVIRGIEHELNFTPERLV